MPLLSGRFRTRWRTALVAAVLLAGVLLTAPALTSSASAGTGPCGSLSGASRVTIQHVVWVVFENKTSKEVLGSGSPDPYLRGVAANCGLGTAYQATPRNASKMAMTGGSEQGVYGDAGDSPGPDIYSQLGTSWRQYMGYDAQLRHGEHLALLPATQSRRVLRGQHVGVCRPRCPSSG